MTLLWLTLAYYLGLLLGRWWWDTGDVSCNFPVWLWMVGGLALPFIPLLNRIPGLAPSAEGMRWPPVAHFQPIRQGLSPALIVALMIAAFTGGLRYLSHPHHPCYAPSALAYYNLPVEQAFDSRAPKVLLTGFVSSYPLIADKKQKMTISAQSIVVDGIEHAVQGEATLKTNLRQQYAYGQPVRLRGRLVTPLEFPDFSYRDYLAQADVHSVIYDAQIDVIEDRAMGGSLLKQWLYRLRARGEALLNRLLPEPYAGLANGMLLGIDAGIPDDLYEQFNLTGTSHVIVISGSNVSLVSMVFLGLGSALFGKKRPRAFCSLWVALLGIGCYALLVGGDPAVMRAALMGGLVVFATVLERRATALVSLAAACWVMTLWNPLTLWDVGFQLSSSATAGLILFSPTVEKWLKVGDNRRNRQLATLHKSKSGIAVKVSAWLKRLGRFCYGLLSEAGVATLAANISTLPLVVFYFGRVSLVNLPANLLIVPVQPIILFAGSAGVLTGVAGLDWLAWGCLQIAQAFLWWTVMVIQAMAAMPFASQTITGYKLAGLLITYALIALCYAWGSLGTINKWWQKRQKRRHINRTMGRWQTRGMAGVGGVAFAFGLWSMVTGVHLPLAHPSSAAAPQATPEPTPYSSPYTTPFTLSDPQRLEIYFLDIGQGDGILIQTPTGKQVLIDGGREGLRLYDQLKEVLPWRDQSLDLVIMTHPDADHMAAQIDLPKYFSIASAADTAIAEENPDSIAWQQVLKGRGIKITQLAQGDQIDLGADVILDVLWPPKKGFTPPSSQQNLNQNQQNEDNSYDNQNGLVLRLTFQDFSLLLTADIDIVVEQALIEKHTPLASTLLKVGHHGSQTSSSTEFLQAVNPQIAIIQAGFANEYGHPHRVVLDHLKGITVLRNDLQGRIHVTTDGKQFWVAAERNYALRRVRQ